MKFRVQASDLNEALSIVGIVPPRPVTPQGGSGYLFVVKGEQCFIHSRDALRRVRAEVAITDVDGVRVGHTTLIRRAGSVGNA